MPLQKDKKVEILELLEQLPDSKMEEVLDFVEYLKIKDEGTSSGIDESSLRLQGKSLRKIWNSPEEDLYEL